MKRIFIPIIACAMALGMFGCAGANSATDSADDSGQTSNATNSESGATDATGQTEDVQQDSATDIHGLTSPVSNPPIPCTKEATLENVTLMLPEDWTAEVGIGGYLKINSGENIVGTMSVEESDLNASNSDEELMAYVTETMEAQKDAGFTIEEGLKVERKGDLAYIVVPFSADQTDSEGNQRQFWGYSMCGYDNELIVIDLSDTEDDKEVLETFKWIVENVQVS